MKAFLLYLVSLFTFVAASAQSAGPDTVPDPGQRWRYAFEITTPKAAITGIMIVKETDNEILGSMFNEFGVSAIEFRYDKKKDKIKLVNVIGFLNKWYIRMTLKKDIRLSLHILFDIPYKPNKNYVITDIENGCKLANKKRKLTYTFNRIPAPEYDTEE